MEKVERWVRNLLIRRCTKQNNIQHTEVPLDDEDERMPTSYRQFYLLFHHVGYYFYLFAYSGFLESMENNSFFFYFTLFALTLSLDLYYFASKDPGFVTKEPSDTTDLHFCQVCNLHVPIRACHCRSCGRCVKRRDHHCPWTNCCVGRDNHIYFILWLMVEFLVMVGINLDIILSLIHPKPILQWFLDNAGLLAIFVLTMFDLGLISWLLSGHFVMIAKNFTVWEQKRRKRISYLKNLPDGMYPFDQGIVQNVIEFLTMSYTDKEWPMPREVQLEDLLREKQIACERFGLDPEVTLPLAMRQSSSVLM